MQLYEVAFQSNLANTIDIGSALVCAPDQKTAKEMVIALLGIPAKTLVRCDATRVKPNLFILERRAADKPKQSPEPTPEQIELTYQPSQKGLRAIAGQLAERRKQAQAAKIFAEQREWAQATGGGGLNDLIEYDCKTLATVIAPDEGTALRRVGRDLIRRGNGERAADDFNVEIMLVELRPVRRVA